MEVIKQINLDMAQPTFVSPITCFQGDSGRAVEIKLSQGGALWTVPTDTEAVVRYRNARGEGGTYDTLPGGAKAWEILKNGVRVQLSPQVCAVPGQTRVQVTLLQGGSQVTVVEFLLEVLPTATGEASGAYVNLSAWLQAQAMDELKGHIDAQLGVLENGAY